MIKRIKARVKQTKAENPLFIEAVVENGKYLASYSLKDSTDSIFRISNVEYNRKLYFVVEVATPSGAHKVFRFMEL